MDKKMPHNQGQASEKVQKYGEISTVLKRIKDWKELTMCLEKICKNGGNYKKFKILTFYLSMYIIERWLHPAGPSTK